MLIPHRTGTKTQEAKIIYCNFGASKSSTRCADIVRIAKDGKGEILELLTVLHICQPLSAYCLCFKM